LVHSPFLSLHNCESTGSVFSIGLLNGNFLNLLDCRFFYFEFVLAALRLEDFAILKGGSSLSSPAKPSEPTSTVG